MIWILKIKFYNEFLFMRFSLFFSLILVIIFLLKPFQGLCHEDRNTYFTAFNFFNFKKHPSSLLLRFSFPELKSPFDQNLELEKSIGYFYPQCPPCKEDKPKKKWVHESELAAVKVGGNVNSESYSIKQKTEYTANEKNIYQTEGRYLNSLNNGVQNGLSWEISFRYKRVYNEKFSVFLQHGAESNIFSGYIQRDISDLGARFVLFENQTHTFLSEIGIRNRYDLNVSQEERTISNNGRLYLEYKYQFNPSTSGRFWTEYSPNFTTKEAWLLNIEPSLLVNMSTFLKIKIAYFIKYQNQPAVLTALKKDTTLTTSLVAVFK
jgi:putative salt-induced outer membrane protein